MSRISQAAFIGSQISMIRGNTPIYKTYAAETEPIYAHLDNPDAPTPTAAQIKADIITAWDGLWNAIDTRTFVNDVLGVKTDDAVSETNLEKQYRFITCLYPKDTKDMVLVQMQTDRAHEADE